jgi:hypothetical protein
MNVRMPLRLEQPYLIELSKYKKASREGRLEDAWTFLERAHVLGQYHPVPHTAMHWRMLQFAVRHRDAREVLGQLLRLSVGWFGSLLNRVPVGNTGGAGVPILASMPIPEDLVGILSDADTEPTGLAGLKR